MEMSCTLIRHMKAEVGGLQEQNTYDLRVGEDRNKLLTDVTIGCLSTKQPIF